ncbi:STAS domain-containing protein [Nonomuraea sp. bgisy101]|uniref:STAS domain-containing protein n=1 Tax=Nonomuraea sp. bgisy101 TaxID=3413784 RepID=UPI003D726DEB
MITTVMCRGEVDIATAEQLERLLVDVLSRSRPDVVLDLREVTFLDAGGLTALIRADDRARRLGGRSSRTRTSRRSGKVISASSCEVGCRPLQHTP